MLFDNGTKYAYIDLLQDSVYSDFIDKVKAKAKAWRIPEKVLLGLSSLGGAYGGCIGVFGLRHKTKHWYFPFLNVLGVIIHTAIIIGLVVLL